jgi:hypothetical protein
VALGGGHNNAFVAAFSVVVGRCGFTVDEIVFLPAAIAALSECNVDARPRPAIEGASQGEAHRQMDMSLFIGAPLGLGVLLALGILMVAMSYLSQ